MEASCRSVTPEANYLGTRCVREAWAQASRLSGDGFLHDAVLEFLRLRYDTLGSSSISNNCRSIDRVYCDAPTTCVQRPENYRCQQTERKCALSAAFLCWPGLMGTRASPATFQLAVLRA